MNKFYVATKENFAKAIIDPTYMLEVMLVCDGGLVHTRLTAAIQWVRRIDGTPNMFEVHSNGISSHTFHIHII